MIKPRIVVTGLGVVSPIGIGWQEFWDNLTKGKSGISPIEGFDTSNYSRHYGAEVKDFDPLEFMDKRKAQILGRPSQMAIASTRLALEDAFLNANFREFKIREYSRIISDNSRTAILMGTTMGEIKKLEKIDDIWTESNHEKVANLPVLLYPSNIITSDLAYEFKIKGHNFMLPTACASGNYAIGYAFDLLSSGRIDLAICGGVDEFSRITFCGFGSFYAMAETKCQPFDQNRQGMLLGEGCGILILERLEDAQKRNAPIYAEISGYGLSCDAQHMVHPSEEGIVKCMQKALKESELNPDDVDYISAHGTGTHENDKAECSAIKKLFNTHYKQIPVNSIKSMLGHPMGAASAIEAIACALSCKFDIIPPTINYETPDPECDIDCVPNKARRQEVNVALNNSYAFGGNNACLVIRKFIS